MYIETSAPRRPGDKARLISPTINGNFAQCVSFYYHMYGPHVKALNVYLATGANATLGSPDWTRVGTQANAWVLGQLQIAGGSLTQGVTNVSKIKYWSRYMFNRRVSKSWSTSMVILILYFSAGKDM